MKQPAKKVEKNNIRVVNMSSEGGYILPKITESSRSRKAHVEYGIESTDDFFTMLIRTYETSPTNQAAIDSSTDLIFGKGVKAKDRLALEEYLYTLTTEDEIRKIVFDYKLFGNAAIQCVFNENRDKIIGFYHIPVDTLRAEKVDELGNIPGYYYSPDWLNKNIKPKYITLKTDEKIRLIYGMEKIDKSKPIFVVEGPIDSLFLPNSLACLGVGNFLEVREKFQNQDLIFVVDNEPRNKVVVEVLYKLIENKEKVCVFPDTIKEKDINDMVLNGINVYDIIETHIHKGAAAMLAFNAWRKCQ